MKEMRISCGFMKNHRNFWKLPVYKLTIEVYYHFSWDQEHAFRVNFPVISVYYTLVHFTEYFQSMIVSFLLEKT